MSQQSGSLVKVPHSKEAEEALIGAALINPDILALTEITANDFYIHRLRLVWSTMREMYQKGITPDFVTLTDALQSGGHMEMIGGAGYLASLLDIPSSLNADSYAAVIKDRSRRRAMIATATELAKAAYNDDAKLDEAQIKAITDLTASTYVRGAARPLREYVDNLELEVIERIANPLEIFGLQTGLLDFDNTTGGLQRGEVLYIGGDPGIGKSILMMQMSIGMAKHGSPGAIYSLEMKGAQMTRRIVSNMSKVETRKLRTGRMTKADMDAFTAAVEAARGLPVYMSDDSYLTTNQLRADLARLQAQHGIQWFALDYLLLMSDGDGQVDEIERSAMLSARIKRLSKEFDLAGITVNSVTKDGKIRGSNQVSHDADVIIMLTEHQPDMGAPKPNMRTLKFIKGRELANPRNAIHMVKAEGGYPAFLDVARV